VKSTPDASVDLLIEGMEKSALVIRHDKSLSKMHKMFVFAGN